MFKIEDGYCKGFFEDYEGIKDYTNLPRQIFPKAYQPNGYLDIAKRESIESGSTAFGAKIVPALTKHVTEVDTEQEFTFIRFQLSTEKSIVLENLKENFSAS